MRFSASLCAVAAFAVWVFAAENPLHEPTTEIIAGQENTIRWTSTTPGKVTLYLKQGKPEDLKTIQEIDSVDGSTGMLTWKPSTSLPADSNYAIEIVSEDDQSNYTALLPLKNDSSDASSSASASTPTSSTSTSSEDASSASATASSTSHPYSYPSTMVTAPVSTGTGSPYIHGYGHNATYHNRTSTQNKYSKSSASSSSSSETASSTSSQSTGKVSAIPPSPSDSGAMGFVRSPLAFVICVFGAIVYLN